MSHLSLGLRALLTRAYVGAVLMHLLILGRAAAS